MYDNFVCALKWYPAKIEILKKLVQDSSIHTTGEQGLIIILGRPFLAARTARLWSPVSVTIDSWS